jgi:hypothetical protein
MGHAFLDDPIFCLIYVMGSLIMYQITDQLIMSIISLNTSSALKQIVESHAPNFPVVTICVLFAVILLIDISMSPAGDFISGIFRSSLWFDGAGGPRF